MNIFEFPFALIAFLGFVAVIPPWMYFAFTHPNLQAMPTHTKFLITLILPCIAALYLASWLSPGGIR